MSSLTDYGFKVISHNPPASTPDSYNPNTPEDLMKNGWVIEQRNSHRSSKEEDIDSRLWKGYKFEMKVREEFTTNPHIAPFITFEGNPTDWEEWKSKQGGISHPDSTITINCNNEKYNIELKLCNTRIYDCWVNRDWIDRNSDIFVVSNRFSISYEKMCELESMGKKIMTVSECIVYLSNKIWDATHPKEEMERREIEFKEQYLKQLSWKRSDNNTVTENILRGNQAYDWNSNFNTLYLQSPIVNDKIIISKLTSDGNYSKIFNRLAKTDASLASSANNSPQTNDKSMDTGLESRNTTFELLDAGSVDSLSYVRKMMYAVAITENISKLYESRIPRLPSGIEKELCLAEYQATKLMSATLCAKILNMDKISRNQYVV